MVSQVRAFTLDLTWPNDTLPLWSSLQETHNPSLITRRTADNSQLRGILQNTWVILLKAINVIQNKESLRNCHSQQEPKETWRLSETWHPETQRLHREKHHEQLSRQTTIPENKSVTHNRQALVSLIYKELTRH